MRRLLSLLLFLSAFASVQCWAQERITVFAAASMKDAMEEAGHAYEIERGVKVVISFAASSILAKQIEAGAPADVFVSADLVWMDWLAERGVIKTETSRSLAGNRLVIVAAAGAPPLADPDALLADGRFAMGDPEHVPAGKYAKAALESLDLWEEVRGNAVFTENVRVGLEFVRRGEVAAAIVYGSDRHAAPELAEAYVFPDETHSPILYPAAVTAAGNSAALSFLDFLSGPAGQVIFGRHGFSPVDPEALQ